MTAWPDPWAAESRQARDAAMTTAQRRRGPGQRRGAAELDRLIADLAHAGRPFSADDVRDSLPDVSGAVVGARFRAASQRGQIKPVGTTQTRNPAGHARTIVVWRGTRAVLGAQDQDQGPTRQPPAGDAISAKAHRLLGSGRVRVYMVDGGLVAALVHGDSGTHVVRRTRDGHWSCPCRATSYGRECAHRRAVQLITEQTERLSRSEYASDLWPSTCANAC